jgi:hypothetical protein
MLEIAAAVSLTSADLQISRLAAHTLRVIAMAERLPGAPVNTRMPEEERGKRYPIYEQIGDPKVRVTGRLAWQKRVRRLYGTLPAPHPFSVAVWEECYYRWCTLTELVIRSPQEGLELVDGPQQSGEKWLTVEVCVYLLHPKSHNVHFNAFFRSKYNSGKTSHYSLLPVVVLV